MDDGGIVWMRKSCGGRGWIGKSGGGGDGGWENHVKEGRWMGKSCE